MPLTNVAFAGDHLRDRLLSTVVLPPLRRRLAEASFSCPMGIDATRFAAARRGDRDAARRLLGVTGSPVVAFLGRLVPIKGIPVLLTAFRSLRATHPGAELVIAGDGPERTALPAAAPPGTRFTGELRGAARDALFCAADVLVLPSIELPGGRTEGTPTVALEALAAGVPLVASDTGGLRAACGDAICLVPPGDAAALATAMAAALASPPPRPARVAHDWERLGPRLCATFLHAEPQAWLP